MVQDNLAEQGKRSFIKSHSISMTLNTVWYLCMDRKTGQGNGTVGLETESTLYGLEACSTLHDL